MADPTPELKPAEKEDDPLEPDGGRRKKLLILIPGLLLVVAVGLGAVLVPEKVRFWGSKEGKAAREDHAKANHAEKQGYIYSMEPFLVNLADTETSRYLKIKIEVESRESKDNEEYGKRLPQLRDAVLTVLSSKTYPEIFDSEGKRKLKEEILQKINQLLGTFQIKMIYFNEFVVQ
jgi:flagellar protein FliL